MSSKLARTESPVRIAEISRSPSAPSILGIGSQPTALAFWQRSTRSLVAFNSAFASLLLLPASTLATHYTTWNTFLLPEGIATLEEALVGGLNVSEPKTLDLRIISADGSVRFCSVTVTLILTNGDDEELLWSIIPEPNVVCAPVTPPVLLSAPASPAAADTTHSSALSRRESFTAYSGGFSGSEEEEADSVETVPVSDAMRQLVQVSGRKRGSPWEANVVKFSLKPDAKGSKSEFGSASGLKRQSENRE